ncbi:hypothetical protein HCJ66_12500 [Listeria sp. FSL L7-1582]|uniref:hypothetical protein n=1 Tax=Listeria portnoyi TaxID=2713504 RepID=UPI00164DD416|nr:hypothetical protein [Listeria portnoyi]MBC6310361.1 hypothetical protein [Listeria portnoyi]
MTKNNNYAVPPILERITVYDELEIFEKLRESQEDVENGRTIASSVGWAELGFTNEQ